MQRTPALRLSLWKALAASRRLLLHSVDQAKRVVAPDAGPVAAFAEETSPEIMDRIFEEFNSLSVVYRRPASSFVKVRQLFTPWHLAPQFSNPAKTRQQ